MNISSRKVIFEDKTSLDDYQVVEETYTGRPARVLYGGKYKTAQSGVALDDTDLMLFEYNQRLVEIISQYKPKRVLAIGGGAFTLPTYIASKHKDITFDVVEPDKKLQDIASKYFNFKTGGNVNVFADFGLHYLKKNHRKYDLIVIDAYLDSEIPEEILTKKFAKLASSSLNKKGMVAANVISDLGAESTANQMHRAYAKYFKLSKLYPAGPDRIFYYPTNFIYVLSNQPINFKLKYPALSSDNLRD